jgi:CheY-like chemotaxis protein
MTQLLKNKQILVVDDEDMFREVLAEQLTFEGADISQAPNGLEALSLALNHHFDAIITDIRMPVMDGIGLINQLHERLNYIPKIFICSGYSGLSSSDVQDLKVDNYFQKPYPLHELVRKVAAALN